MSIKCVIAEDHGCPHKEYCGSDYGIVYEIINGTSSFFSLVEDLAEGFLRKKTKTNQTWKKDRSFYACKPGNLETEAESGR